MSVPAEQAVAWRMPRPAPAIAMVVVVASGFAGLGYQIVWTQQGALWLGHEAAAVLAVVAAFFGGLSLGAWRLGPSVERSRHPARWYAACETVIAAWSMVLALVHGSVSRGLLEWIGPQPTASWQWSASFLGTFLLLLPATMAMGATLPALERALASLRGAPSTRAALYAGNTFGAMVGVLATAFWLIPALGLTGTAGICAGINLCCAATALLLLEPSPAAAVVTSPATRIDRHLLGLLATTGLLGIGYEVVVVYVLRQVAENTVYTFALLLAVYLGGTALGAAAFGRFTAAHRRDAADLRDRLLCALAAACLLGGFGLYEASVLKSGVLAAFGPGVAAALAAEALLAVATFLPPTIVMGALFSHLATQARGQGIGFGAVLGVNTLGAAVAPIAVGVVLVPLTGPKLAWLMLVAAYLALTSRRARSGRIVIALGVVVLAIGVLARPLAFVDLPPGGRVVRYEEGVTAAVSVVADADDVLRLRIDNRQQEGSSATVLADARQGLLPILLHPAPRRALFLGLGTGVTANAAALDADLRVDAVELVPEVVATSTAFTQRFGDGVPNPRLHLLTADARRYVLATDATYDVIVSDNFHPARSGSGALYTVEHFTAVRARLAPGGVFCQWLPLHQLDLDTLRSIVRAFLAVYPHGGALLATYSLETPTIGLVATRDGERFDPTALEARVGEARLPEPAAGYGIDDALALLGTFIAGPASLATFAGDAPLNTDDRPVVTYRAPWVTYAPVSQPRDRLITLLHDLKVSPGDVLANPDAAIAERLAAYWSARTRFVEAGRDVQPSADPRRMLAQVQGPLLEALSTSPDFRPAYDPLLRLALALSARGDAQGRVLLAELARIQPGRPEALDALRTGTAASP